MQTSPVPGVWCGAVPTRYRRNPLGFAHAFTPPSRENIATVERTASFRSCSVHRPQRTRPQSPAASSAEPSPFGPFPPRIPGSWERSQHRFLVFLAGASLGCFQEPLLAPTPSPCVPCGRSAPPQPSGRRAARSATPSTATVGGSATLPPVRGCACDAQRYPAPAADAPVQTRWRQAARGQTGAPGPLAPVPWAASAGRIGRASKMP